MLMFTTVLLSLSVILGSVTDADTPDMFLENLASATPEEWVESMAYQNNEFHPDTVRNRIESFLDLAVDPGERILEDFEGGYRAVFSESRWTWKLSGGTLQSVIGETVVEWRPGGYRWVTTPVFTESAATVRPEARICTGIIAMVGVLLVSVIGVWYAKRRYGQ